MIPIPDPFVPKLSVWLFSLTQLDCYLFTSTSFLVPDCKHYIIVLTLEGVSIETGLYITDKLA